MIGEAGMKQSVAPPSSSVWMKILRFRLSGSHFYSTANPFDLRLLPLHSINHFSGVQHQYCGYRTSRTEPWECQALDQLPPKPLRWFVHPPKWIIQSARSLAFIMVSDIHLCHYDLVLTGSRYREEEILRHTGSRTCQYCLFCAGCQKTEDTWWENTFKSLARTKSERPDSTFKNLGRTCRRRLPK
jgi:hypothetical protein